MEVLVTGCGGLVGAEAVEYFSARGAKIVGIDNNMRSVFFGPAGDVRWNIERLKKDVPGFQFFEMDIRSRASVTELFEGRKFDVIIHCAAQPSHDKAASIPTLDFEVNAVGTLNLLEAFRTSCPKASFVHVSTNKVYGDTPNTLELVELETRYDFKNEKDRHGINENCSIDQSLHSLFGASKAAADLVAQEYGRYFHLNVGIFRCGCLTGPLHSGVPLHGFLSYLVKTALNDETYTIIGYKGKQVRDQLHSEDLVRAFECYALNPRPGAVYNMGGGRSNSASILEVISQIEKLLGKQVNWKYSEQSRKGDHICYISDLRKFSSDYPGWRIEHSLNDILEEMIEFEKERLLKRA